MGGVGLVGGQGGCGFFFWGGGVGGSVGGVGGGVRVDVNEKKIFLGGGGVGGGGGPGVSGRGRVGGGSGWM